jgi:UDP-glucose 4-epimerase
MKASLAGQSFDVGTGDNISLNEMKDIVNEHFPEVQFDYVEERKGDVLLTKADMSPLKELGWEPKKQIKEGISQCFEILKGQLA